MGNNGKSLADLLSSRNLVTTTRIIYPGILLITFLYWRNSKIVGNVPVPLVFLIILPFGIGFYATYRYGFYEMIIWNIERFLGTKHQWKFHCKIVDNLAKSGRIRNPKNFKKHRIAMVYVGEIIKKQPTEFKEHIRLVAN